MIYQPTVIDLFAGCGGLALGFAEAGITPVFAVEADRDAASTYAANFGKYHTFWGKIEDVPPKLYPKADVIIGGPPCQGFSSMGKGDDTLNVIDVSSIRESTLSTESSRTVTTDIRCPSGSNSLLLRVLSEGKAPIEFINSQLLQLHCKECTKNFRRISGSDQILRVLHVMTTEGDFINTQIQFRDGAEKEIDPEAQASLLQVSSKIQFLPPRP